MIDQEGHDVGGALAPSVVREIAIDVGSADFPEYVKRLWDGPLSAASAFEQAQEIVKIQAILVPASIKLTKPQDWVKFGDKLYFQGTGGERINGLWGMIYAKPTCTCDTFPDGTYIYTVAGGCASARTRVIFQEIIGGRWSGEPFFRKYEKDEQTGEKVLLPVNPLDVKKAAYTNWMLNCLARITGMRNLEPQDLTAAGFTRTNEIKGFEFDSGSKGGKGRTATAGGAITCPPKFGPANCRGKAITDGDVTEANLRWYKEKAEANIADASKSQYHAKESHWLKAIDAELERRAGNTDAEKAAK